MEQQTQSEYTTVLDEIIKNLHGRFHKMSYSQ